MDTVVDLSTSQPVAGGGDLIEAQGAIESSATELASNSQRLESDAGDIPILGFDELGWTSQRRLTREERRALQYSRKDLTDNLSISASDVASACGLNPFKRPWELVYKYVYKGFKDLLRMDAENVSVKLVSHEEAVVELIEKSKSVSAKYVF